MRITLPLDIREKDNTRKLQTNIHEHLCKKPKLNLDKSNPTLCKKGNTL